MIPYIHIYDLRIGPLRLHPFGVLVAAGVIVGTWLAKRQARNRLLDVGALSSFIAWMLVGGFLGGHVLDEVFYHPAELVQQPLSFLYVWNGLSSFGGFIGGACGAAAWKFYELVPALRLGPIEIARPVRRLAPAPILAFCDVVLSVFPVAWVFGRAGCTIAHDHPGLQAPAQSFAAVAYGPGPVRAFGFFELRYGNTPRYDLGLLEFLFALVVALAFASTWKKSFPLGTYVTALPLIYAPVRFSLDYLRLNDAQGGDLRYSGLTPAQWACLALFAIGLWFGARNGREAHA